jgi:hypothetical protein
MVEISLVNSLEGVLVASIKTSSEFNGGVRARAKVESSALDLCRCSSVAGSFLGVAVTDVGSCKSSCIGSICAVGVLDGAGALESGSEVDEGVSVDGEWSGTSGGGDGWCCTSEGSSEGLLVG